MANVLVKAPGEVLDYVFDWNDSTQGPVLASGETISSSSWTVDTGITKDSDTNDTTTSTIWLSSGSRRAVYTCTNTVVTDNATARTYTRVLMVRVEDR